MPATVQVIVSTLTRSIVSPPKSDPSQLCFFFWCRTKGLYWYILSGPYHPCSLSCDQVTRWLSGQRACNDTSSLVLTAPVHSAVTKSPGGSLARGHAMIHPLWSLTPLFTQLWPSHQVALWPEGMQWYILSGPYCPSSLSCDQVTKWLTAQVHSAVTKSPSGLLPQFTQLWPSHQVALRTGGMQWYILSGPYCPSSLSCDQVTKWLTAQVHSAVTKSPSGLLPQFTQLWPSHQVALRTGGMQWYILSGPYCPCSPSCNQVTKMLTAPFHSAVTKSPGGS